MKLGKSGNENVNSEFYYLKLLTTSYFSDLQKIKGL